EAYFSIAPDWIGEVLSPSTARTDRAVKMPIYAGESVQWLWLIDPNVRILEVYRLFEAQWLLENIWQNDDVVKAPPFDAISMNLSDFWAPQA
ncbi:MAG: Uma2 family endonuclease, partial [Methylococcales bacterium]